MPPSGRRLPFPIAPHVPPTLEPAPPLLDSLDSWDKVVAGEGTEVAQIVADAQLHEVIWTNAQLVGRRFTELVCVDVRFVRCDLAGVLFEDCQFTRVLFESCRMSGAVLAGATLQEVELVDCVADSADFRMAHVRRSTARRTTLREADFYGCGLVDVRLATCDLTGASFQTARVDRLDLRGSTVDGLRGVDSLGGARITTDQVGTLGASLIGSLGFHIE